MALIILAGVMAGLFFRAAGSHREQPLAVSPDSAPAEASASPAPEASAPLLAEPIPLSDLVPIDHAMEPGAEASRELQDALAIYNDLNSYNKSSDSQSPAFQINRKMERFSRAQCWGAFTAEGERRAVYTLIWPDDSWLQFVASSEPPGYLAGSVLNGDNFRDVGFSPEAFDRRAMWCELVGQAALWFMAYSDA